MKKSEQLLFELIQVSIGTRKELSCQPTWKQWVKLYKLCEKQTILGIGFAGLSKLPIQNDNTWKSPERIALRTVFGQWALDAEAIKVSNETSNNALADVAALLNETGISYAVIKGQICANNYFVKNSQDNNHSLNYPLSAYRTPGDIDFYVAAKDYQRAKQIITQRLQVEIHSDEDADKHDVFDYKGIRFEMHYRLETFGRKTHQKKFDSMIEKVVLDPSSPTMIINNVPVRVLPIEEHITMVFKHMFNHLLIDGVGLRQFMDIFMLLESYKGKIDNDKLRKELVEIGYEKALKATCALLVKYMGMSKECIPYELTDSDFKWAERIVEVPLRHGNFGKFNRNYNSSGWRKSFETANIAFKHSIKFMPLAWSDIIGLLFVRTKISIKKYL